MGEPTKELQAQAMRLRSMAKRQGKVLHKSRVRDPYASDFGVFTLSEGRKVLLRSTDLDEIEAHLKQR